LAAEYEGSESDLPDLVDERFAELETALAGFDDRPVQYDVEDIARAGAFVSIAADGRLRIESGYVRPEDEPMADRGPDDDSEQNSEAASSVNVTTATESAEAEDDDGLAPISDKLLTELTAHRTLGLRYALGARPDVAFLAALHALVLKAFYHHALETCLELDLRSSILGNGGPGLQDSPAAEVIRSRHDNWSKALPDDPVDLWTALGEWDADSRSALFAHAVSLSVNAVHESWSRRPGLFAHADHLSQAVELDMAKIWRPSSQNYLGRVTKGRILQAVAEAKGQRAADRLAHLKKGDMATEAETLLDGSGWLPDVLRSVGNEAVAEVPADADSAAEAETDVVDDAVVHHEDHELVHPIAAE